MKKTLDLLMMVLGTYTMKPQFSATLKGIGFTEWGLKTSDFIDGLYLVTSANSLQPVVVTEHH
jgi:hypothetical protein